jgi:hypothetical protein
MRLELEFEGEHEPNTDFPVLDQGVHTITFESETGLCSMEGWFDTVAHWGAAVWLRDDQRRQLAAALLEDLTPEVGGGRHTHGANRIEVLDNAGTVLGSGPAHFLADGNVECNVRFTQAGMVARLRFWVDEWAFPELDDLDGSEAVNCGDYFKVTEFRWDVRPLADKLYLWHKTDVELLEDWERN